MRVAIVANCQGRPVANLMRLMCSDVEIATVVIVHLAKTDDLDAYHADLSKADAILAQFTTEEYRSGHFATSRLRQQFHDRVISWPNVFFRGQSPDLAYAAADHLPNILGPLREYHLRGIYGCWKRAMTRDDCIAMLRTSDPLYQPIVEAIATQSLSELRRREQTLDVGVADFIDENWRRESLFFTFNHPTLTVLSELTARLLEKLGLRPTGPPPDGGTEPLGLVAPPVLRREVEGHTKRQASEVSGGAALLWKDGKLAIGARCNYSLDELVSQYYAAYDGQLGRNDEVRFSPPASVEEKPVELSA